MATRKSDDTVVHELSQSREERARAFAQYLKEQLIDYQHRQRVWITSATEVGKLLGVSDVTANDWLRGKTIPRREQCVRIASTFGIPFGEVLEAAGYLPTQDDSYNTYAALLAAVERAEDWPKEKRDKVVAALYEAMSPPFATDPKAKEWDELALLVLNQKYGLVSKAEKIASIIELWHHERDQVRVD